MIDRAGIIAAGHGERLRQAFPAMPKAMIPVGGRPLVDWITLGLAAAGARSITIIHNSRGTAIARHLARAFTDLSWTFLAADTASSWESFRLVARALAPHTDRMLISAVDALVAPAEVQRFAASAFADDADAGLALTRFVDDEKPLWAEIDREGIMTALGDQVRRRRAVTSGIYALRRTVVAAMPAATAHGRLRDYWTELVTSNIKVRGVLLADTVDLDRIQDLPAAEKVTSSFGA